MFFTVEGLRRLLGETKASLEKDTTRLDELAERDRSVARFEISRARRTADSDGGRIGKEGLRMV